MKRIVCPICHEPPPRIVIYPKRHSRGWTFRAGWVCQKCHATIRITITKKEAIKKILEHPEIKKYIKEEVFRQP